MSSTKSRNKERGVALLFAILALLLLTAIAAALIFMTNMETEVNQNYRAETQAYYAARAGVLEARDRMRIAGDAVNTNLPNPAGAVDPMGNANTALYIINQGTDPSAITPWNNAAASGARTKTSRPSSKPCATRPGP